MAKNLLTANIIDELGLKGLPDAEKQKLLDRMSAIVQTRVGRRIDDALNDVQRAQFSEILETNDEQKIKAFLDGNVPGYSQLVSDEIVSFKAEILEEAAALRGAVA